MLIPVRTLLQSLCDLRAIRVGPQSFHSRAAILLYVPLGPLIENRSRTERANFRTPAAHRRIDIWPVIYLENPFITGGIEKTSEDRCMRVREHQVRVIFKDVQEKWDHPRVFPMMPGR